MLLVLLFFGSNYKKTSLRPPNSSAGPAKYYLASFSHGPRVANIIPCDPSFKRYLAYRIN